SAAEESGIQAAAVIVGIDDHAVTSVSELQEWVARNRPGKEIKVIFLRNGQKKEAIARLKDYEGNISVTRKEIKYEISGAVFEDVPYKELNELNLEGGVRIKHLSPGKWKEGGLEEGFIISYIDKVPVENVEDMNRILEFKNGGILIEGFTAQGDRATLGMEW